MTISLNGTSQGGYDGSAAKSVNITPSSIGAAASSHSHTSTQISDATNANTANKIVKRDASGNFSAGTITATLNGTASNATKVTNSLVVKLNNGATENTNMFTFNGSGAKSINITPSGIGAEPAFTKNTAFNKNFGTAAGTVCQGNDSRLSDARRASNIVMVLSGTNLWIEFS